MTGRHLSSGLMQVPQLGLQHTKPTAHTVWPQIVPDPTGLARTVGIAGRRFHSDAMVTVRKVIMLGIELVRLLMKRTYEYSRPYSDYLS